MQPVRGRVLPSGLILPDANAPVTDRFIRSTLGMPVKAKLEPLMRDTTVWSSAEEACKTALLATGIRAYHELHKLDAGDGIHTWKPDFTLRLTINGRLAVVEAHGFASRHGIVKQMAASIEAVHNAYQLRQPVQETIRFTDAQNEYLDRRAESYVQKTELGWTKDQIREMLERMLATDALQWNMRGGISNLHIAKHAVRMLTPHGAMGLSAEKAVEITTEMKKLLSEDPTTVKLNTEIAGAIKSAFRGAEIKMDDYLGKVKAIRKDYGLYVVMVSGGQANGTAKYVNNYWNVSVTEAASPHNYTAGVNKLVRRFKHLAMQSDQRSLYQDLRRAS